MVTEATIPKGYKQTEVGVIPADWDAIALGKISTSISSGKSSTQTILGGDYFIYGSTGIIGTCVDFDYEGERILVARVGANAGTVNCVSGKYCVSDNTLMIQLKNKVDFQFILYFLIHSNLNKMIFGSGQPLITGSQLKTLIIPLPPTDNEQTAIAEALSDTDDLIDSLDKLITKKRNLKQAAMQQLLTGKTRLPGFTDQWEEKTLGDHVEFLRHGVNSRAELTINDPVKYLHYGDIHACNNVRLCPNGLPSLPASKAKTLDRLSEGDLIFADASEDLDGVGKSVEIIGVSDTECVSGLHTIAARFDKDVLADGFKGYLQFCPEFISQLRRLAAGTKVYATNRSHIAGIEMHLPDTIEQTAIAEVLSDMDSSIEALEERRDKVWSLKQGMMQQLLTGRIRLV